MPTYTVSTAANRLTPRHKARIAHEITRIHKAVTGAHAFFAQVIFAEVAPGNHFVGGKPLQHDLIFVHAHIRSGRTSAQKKDLLTQLVDAIAQAANAPLNAVWVYIAELPPAQMAEFGHLLPEPGTEAGWFQSLPPDDRDLMERIGR